MELDLVKIQNTWMKDILYRIEQIIKDNKYNHEEKILAIRWLVKQTLKGDTDND